MWFYPLQGKYQFLDVLKTFIPFVQTQFSCKLKVFQSDGGTESINHQVKKLFPENGTHHQLSCPYSPQQNGRAERKHRHVTDTGLAMLFGANVPASRWADSFTFFVHIINRLPNPVLQNKSPYELLYNSTPLYKNFKKFGCRVFPYWRPYTSHKLEIRSIECVFIGYNPQHKGYKCLDLSKTQNLYHPSCSF